MTAPRREGTMDEARPEVSIVMPCLDEAETLAACIAKAREAIERHGLQAEIVVADNGSRDGSPAIARAHGARCVGARERGYGAALQAGIAAAEGAFVVMGDADDSYDFRAIEPFLRQLRAGADLVIGCRVARGGGTILPGAMPWSHRWIGVPLLSGLGRLLFGSPVRDFHCGLRAFRRDAILGLDLRTPGMEFASEMVIRATLAGWRIAEVPITLSPAGRTRPSHLRAWRDGWRHLFLLLRLWWAAPPGRRHPPGASDGMKPSHQTADRDQRGEGGGGGRQRGEAAFGEE